MSHVFLDFDGVLNRSRDFIGADHRLPIHKHALRRLTEFVAKNKLKVVISSSHRMLYGNREGLRGRLGDLVDYIHDDWRTGNDRRGYRGNEVRQWIMNHQEEVERYIIFDDNSDFYAYQPLVRTGMADGLTDADIVEAQQLLDTQKAEDCFPGIWVCYKQGDLTQAERASVIAHGCNAQGVMGSGVAKAIRETYPEAWRAYRKTYEERGLQLGEVIWAQDKCKTTYSHDIYIANVITQRYYGRDGKKYLDDQALRNGMIEVVKGAIERGFYEVCIPKIGAGYGGGDWDSIEADLMAISQITGVKFTVFEIPIVQPKAVGSILLP